jgi:hypothetical protein
MIIHTFKAKQGQKDRQRHKAAVLDAWDRLFPKAREARQVGKQSRLDTDAEVRRKAKEAL